jgi:Uma2 family endonuclease
MRVHIPSSGRFVYPDASVVCGRPQYKDEQIDSLLNPRIIVEVLSPSTEAYDRGDKFTNYRSIPSLMHYIMAAQDKPFVEVYTRQEDESWELREYGPESHLALSAIDCSISVDQIYAGVFDEYDVG